MKKFLFSLLFLILCSAGSYAENISREQASLAAHNFLYERLSARTSVNYEDLQIKDVIAEYSRSVKVLYIVNFRNGGWVILPATNSAPPVIAYSYKGEFTGTNVPPQLQGYMESIKSQLNYNLQNRTDSKEFDQAWRQLLQENPANLKEFTGRSLGPFLSTTWDQGVYYNEMCPADASGPGGHCLTGCVATAMAQLMNYFRWPEQAVIPILVLHTALYLQIFKTPPIIGIKYLYFWTIAICRLQKFFIIRVFLSIWYMGQTVRECTTIRQLIH